MPPEIGTLYCYKTGCGHAECLDANRAYQRRQRRLKAYGRWAPLVDAEPVRRHVRELQAAGIGIRRIAELSGIGPRSIGHLLYGRPADGLAPAKRVKPTTAAAILAVRPSLEAYAPHAKVDATGTRRRIEALCAVGWSIARQARELGMDDSTVYRFLQTKGVEAVSAIAVRDLYERLWDQPPPEETKGDRIASGHARGNARRRGWAPPMAWDDESIDDPSASPEGAGYKPARGKLPAAAELQHLVAGGDSLEVLAARYDVEVASVYQRLHRSEASA